MTKFVRVEIRVCVFLLILGIANTACPQAPVNGTPTFAKDLQDVKDQLQDVKHQLDTADLKRVQLQQTVDTNTTSNRFFITLLSTIIGGIVVLQGVFQGLALRHQWVRDSERDSREQKKDDISNTGARTLTDVFGVIRETMETRLIREKEAQDEAKEAKGEVESIRSELTRVLEHFKHLAGAAHDRLETAASDLAKLRRHDFKVAPNRLEDFAREYDDYVRNLEPLAGDLFLSVRARYIRGIAAHFMSQPDLVKQYLLDVTANSVTQPDENDLQNNRRLASSFYYLGVNESNFANYADAVHLLTKANDLDLDHKDLLSRIVTAECFIFDQEYDRAHEYINSEIEERIGEMKRSKEFRPYHVPLQVRGKLLKANLMMLRGDSDWASRAKKEFQDACKLDPESYYALSSLGQLAYSEGAVEAAADLFLKAFEAILKKGHIESTSEVRSRILLLMVAGMCCELAPEGSISRDSREFFEEARGLLDRLPKRGDEECTVYSPLSKRNENRNVIAGHIGFLETHQVLVLPKTDA